MKTIFIIWKETGIGTNNYYPIAVKRTETEAISQREHMRDTDDKVNYRITEEEVADPAEIDWGDSLVYELKEIAGKLANKLGFRYNSENTNSTDTRIRVLSKLGVIQTEATTESNIQDDILIGGIKWAGVWVSVLNKDDSEEIEQIKKAIEEVNNG